MLLETWKYIRPLFAVPVRIDDDFLLSLVRLDHGGKTSEHCNPIAHRTAFQASFKVHY